MKQEVLARRAPMIGEPASSFQLFLNKKIKIDNTKVSYEDGIYIGKTNILVYYWIIMTHYHSIHQLS